MVVSYTLGMAPLPGCNRDMKLVFLGSGISTSTFICHWHSARGPHLTVEVVFLFSVKKRGFVGGDF